MSVSCATVDASEFPLLLREIPQPPTTLWYRGTLPPPTHTLLTVVGSRQYTTYGKEVVDTLIDGLRGYPIGIVSGLALGIDALAHEAALRNNLYTLAVPGSGLDDGVLYPRSNRSLALRILERGGGLLSEFPPDTPAAPWTFPQRNRIMAGIAPATLMIEAGEKSGTLITARMCVDYNRELLVVPGSIFSKNAAGPHQFLKLGATPITSSADILDVLQITPRTAAMGAHPLPADDLSPEERAILAVLIEPCSSDHIISATGLTAQVVQTTLMLLELKGHIINSFGTYRVVV